MPDSRKFIAACSIIAGVLLCLLGITSIGFYIYSVIESFNEADQSVIFWYLIFVIMGITLVGTGGYFIWIGYQSHKGEETYAGLAKYSLSGLGTILIILILFGIFSERAADKRRSERIKEEEIQKFLTDEMHHIDQIEIDEFNKTGFSFSVHISDGMEGNYRLNTSIYNSQAVFLEETKEVSLGSPKTRITRRISFDRLFQKCFDEFKESNIYVCIEGTGAKSFFTLESQLILIKDKEQRITQIRDKAELVSVEKTEFSMDTFTKNRQVEVNSFQIVDQ